MERARLPKSERGRLQAARLPDDVILRQEGGVGLLPVDVPLELGRRDGPVAGAVHLDLVADVVPAGKANMSSNNVDNMPIILPGLTALRIFPTFLVVSKMLSTLSLFCCLNS